MWSWILLLGLCSLVQSRYKLCVLHDDTETSQCPLLYADGSLIQCTLGVDRMDCLRLVSEGLADFAVFEAEELVAALEYDEYPQILITHKLRTHLEDLIFFTEDYEFGVVAVVSNSAGITSINQLKGKRLCHPGYDPFSSRYDWNEIFSLYFEERVVQEECEDNLSVEENRIKSLSNFFGDSCKPGTWSPDSEIDQRLKSNYSNLCAVCDIPSRCSAHDKYWGREGALFCLSDCLGDIAWSRLDDVYFHFKSSFPVCGNVSLLCPDGSTIPFDSEKPCLWIARPNPVIAANRKQAVSIQTAIFEMSKDTQNVTASRDNSALARLLGGGSGPKSIPLSTPRDYLETVPGFLSANTMERCGEHSRSIKMCVNTDEKKINCEWLRISAKSFGIQPWITCVLSSNCFESLSHGESDVVITNSDDLYTAISKFNLEPLVVEQPVLATHVYSVSAIVKANSKIHSLSDLRGKNACLTTYDGHGWTSLVMALKDSNLLDPTICPYSKAVSKFFSGMCFTDIHSRPLPHKNMRICSVEGAYVIPDEHADPIPESKKKEKNGMAFHCLANGGGDVAFIPMDTVKQYTDRLYPDEPWTKGLKSKNYRQLCEGNSSSRCILSWSSTGQILVNKKLPKAKREDVISLFTALENIFNEPNAPLHHTLEVFPKIDFIYTIKDDIKGLSTRVESFEQFKKKAKSRPKNFELLVQKLNNCVPSASSIMYITSYLVLTGLCFSYFIQYL